ncbi:MAG: hypothetical protein OXH50_20945 [Gemmatimonadetes bacterium]|nr:hypothetical protein [Gemmatimonadota bacterium]
MALIHALRKLLVTLVHALGKTPLTLVHALAEALLPLIHALGEPQLKLADPQIEAGESGGRIGPQLAQILLDAGETAVDLLEHVAGCEIIGHGKSLSRV